jgi:hypothetical protein
MFGFHVIDTADEFIFSRQFAQPGATDNIIASPWLS